MQSNRSVAIAHIVIVILYCYTISNTKSYNRPNNITTTTIIIIEILHETKIYRPIGPTLIQYRLQYFSCINNIHYSVRFYALSLETETEGSWHFVCVCVHYLNLHEVEHTGKKTLDIFSSLFRK